MSKFSSHMTLMTRSNSSSCEGFSPRWCCETL